MYTESEVSDLSNATFENNIIYKQRKVNGLKYHDPDYNCAQLYDDINRVFFDNTLSIDKDKGQLVLIKDKIRLTSDYIGPSLTSLARAGFSNEEAWEIVIKCQKIGGHLVWPRIANGINPCKGQSGGRGYGISDRIDTALYEIKCFLDDKKNLSSYNTRLRNALKKEVNVKWFDNISFPKFCDFYMLKGSFVDKEYNINWFVKPKIHKLDKTVMCEYVKQNISAIEKRNCVIKEKCIER
jgi:hypothetical protein